MEVSTSFFPVLSVVFFNAILIIAAFAMAVVVFVLFVKLATRGIKALDIYIAKNSNKGLQFINISLNMDQYSLY